MSLFFENRDLTGTYPEPANLLLDIVLEQVAEPLFVAVGELAQLPLKDLLVKDLGDTDATPGLRETRGIISATQVFQWLARTKRRTAKLTALVL